MMDWRRPGKPGETDERDSRGDAGIRAGRWGDSGDGRSGWEEQEEAYSRPLGREEQEEAYSRPLGREEQEETYGRVSGREGTYGRASGQEEQEEAYSRPPKGAGGRRRAYPARGKGGRRRPPKDRRPMLVAAAFVTLVVLAALASAVIKKYAPTKERADLAEYYGIREADDMAVILDGKRLDEAAKYWDGHVYLDHALVQKYLNPRFYWDANENILRYVTPSDVISVNAGSREYAVTRKNESEDYVIVKVDGSTMYLALDFVQKYTNLDFAAYEEPNRVKITSKWGQVQTAQVKRGTQIRVKGGIKSPIVADVEKGDKVTVLDAGEDWSKVLTEDGMIGYLRNKRLHEAAVETVAREFEEPQFSHLLKDGAVSLGWHQVTNQEANGNVAKVLQSTKGINVISPTWFYLNDNDGSLYSLASKEYVDYCHQHDVEVWALVSNLENPDADSTYVLTHTSTRDNLTNQIIAAAIEYNLDGINLDFEALEGEVGDAYIQFVRELSLKCENNSLTLSVDNYVPSEYTAFYDRAEQALFADYVVIMAYDEHYSGSEDIGPVASIGFVRDGVENTLKEVPAEQTILGMPFYSRVWELTMKEGAGESVESAAEDYLPYTFTCFEEGMQTVENRYTENGGEAVWSDEDGQYVTEYESEGKKYKIWIENEASLEEKLKVMKESGLAGAAYWKLGLERPSAWDTIIKYVN